MLCIAYRFDIVDIVVAWLVFDLIYLFFRFCVFEVRAKSTCIAVEVLRLGPMIHEHSIAFLKLVLVENGCLMMFRYYIVYV